MAAEFARSLLSRRLVIVTGKGGTGKTTVSASLALAGAREGRRVLIVEVGRDEQVPRLFNKNARPVGYAGRRIAPGITALRVDPLEALAEYLGIQIRVRSLVDLVLGNAAFRQLMSAAPGWRELITLGKVWQLEQMRDARGRFRFDLIIVDAPASGHSVTFLDAPRVVISAVRTGPLRRQAQDVEQMLTDPTRCAILPVALAEELPARETAELVERVATNVGVCVETIVVNDVIPFPFPRGLEDLDGILARLKDVTIVGRLRTDVLAQCAAYMRARSELNHRYKAEIERTTNLPVTVLPHLPEGIRGVPDLETLRDALMGPVAEPA